MEGLPPACVLILTGPGFVLFYRQGLGLARCWVMQLLREESGFESGITQTWSPFYTHALVPQDCLVIISSSAWSSFRTVMELSPFKMQISHWEGFQ